MSLATLIDSALVFTDLESGSQEALLRSLSEKVAAAGAVPSSERLYEKLAEREHLGSTAVGRGIAIPHCKLSRLEKVVLAVGKACKALQIEGPDTEPVGLFFVLISPEKDPAAHLKGLASISRWVQSKANLERLRRVRSKEDLVDCLRIDSENGQ
ncbi:MAG: PTS sugar transporter subunit IIA [Acidobacteriota bacterium]|nr:PTS sugar transporter subunit IIA [Acidobacteriota bacterium]